MTKRAVLVVPIPPPDTRFTPEQEARIVALIRAELHAQADAIRQQFVARIRATGGDVESFFTGDP